jgi:hypothetical protein
MEIVDSWRRRTGKHRRTKNQKSGKTAMKYRHGIVAPLSSPRGSHLLFDAPQCLGLQLVTVIPAETTSKWSAKYRCAESVRFHALQLLPARFTNVSVRPDTYIDCMSKPACLFLYDRGYPSMFGIDQTRGAQE